jgi:selenocysteine-specific translation elongation factor
LRHLTIGVFEDETLGGELGKKGTLSDIAMYNRKTDEYIFTFMSPVEGKLTAKSQIVSTIDAAIVVFAQMSRELGETIHMLDLLNVKEGIIVTTPYLAADQIKSITQPTSLRSYRQKERDSGMLLELLKQINPPRDAASPVVVVVDHSFNVKGVGEVVLGFVKRGTVRKYDKLSLLPAGKEVLIRSIQVQDEDLEVAEAGTRVGLAIKGATLEELPRGAVLTASSQIKAQPKLNLRFTRSPFYAEEAKEGPFHATIGMRTNLVTASDSIDGSISVASAEAFASEPGDAALLLDLNAKKTRILGRGIVSD